MTHRAPLILALVATALLSSSAQAHCPLCTAGAGALAMLAASLGVSTAVVGLLVGAFALALGMWLAKLVRGKMLPRQDGLLTLGIFAATVFPLVPLIREYRAIHIAALGEYGTTYPVNLYVLGAVIGAALLYSAPSLSRALTAFRGGQLLPFQGMSITLLLLVAGSLILQLLF